MLESNLSAEVGDDGGAGLFWPCLVFLRHRNPFKAINPKLTPLRTPRESYMRDPDEVFQSCKIESSG